MSIRILGALAALLLGSGVALAQSALLQGGPSGPGHVPMYVGAQSAQPIVQDSGTSAGGVAGANLSEIGVTSRSQTNTYPVASGGNGPSGEHVCIYDAPTTNASGYHYLCIDPNALGGALIDYGAGGAAAALPFQMKLNGTTYQLPFSAGGILGPTTTVVGHLATWNNTTGTLLQDLAFLPASLGGTGGLTGIVIGNGLSAPTAIAPGTGVAAALPVNVGTAGSFVVNGGALGTPSSGTLTNATGLPAATGIAGIVPASNGGAGGLTGLVLGNGSSAPTAVSYHASGLVLNVNNVLGTDTQTCGVTTGAGACASWQQAYNNLSNYPVLSSIPTIKGTAGQTYTAGIIVNGGATDAPNPLPTGIGGVILDGQGSSISMPAIDVYCRYAPMGLIVRNLTLISSGSSNIVSRGSCMVSIEQGVTFAGAASNYAAILAFGGGQVATCPVGTCPLNTVTNITGGGQCFAQALNGGQVQIEGANLAISGSPTFTQGFVCTSDLGAVSFSSTTVSGNVTGDQFFGQKMGLIDIAGQSGSYTNCADTYLPGSTCGQLYTGARISETGTATVTGCGTGATVGQYEDSSLVVLGSGLAHVNGTRYSSCILTMATRTKYLACTQNPSDGLILQSIALQSVDPTSSTNQTWHILWVSNGTDPVGTSITFNCHT